MMSTAVGGSEGVTALTYCSWHYMELEATSWTVRGSYPGRGKTRSPPKISRPILGLTHLPVQWVPGFFGWERGTGA